MKNKGLFIFELLLLLLVVIFFVTSLGYETRPRLAPLLVSAGTLLLILGQHYKRLRGLKKPEQNMEYTSEACISDPKPTFRMYFLIFIWVVVLYFLIYLLGFTYGTALYIFFYLKIRGKERWFLSIIIPVVIIALIYFGFTKGLKMYFYPGLIMEYLSGL